MSQRSHRAFSHECSGLVPGELDRARAGAPFSFALMALCLALSGCNSEGPPPIQLAVGNSAAQQRTLLPKAAFAEYLELPGMRNELKVTVANYEASCERFVSPGEDQASVSVVVVTPAGAQLATGTYAWSGHDAHGGSVEKPQSSYAEPTARVGHRGYLFPPGGSVQLTELSLERDGHVDGALAFEFAGDGQRQAMSMKGRFSARICRLNKAAQ